jgi:hypothetical protein
MFVKSIKKTLSFSTGALLGGVIALKMDDLVYS